MPVRSLVGLDVGSKFIKAIQITESKTGLAITGFGKIEVQTQENLPELIGELFHQKNFSTKRVVSSISGRFVIVRYISMPSMTEEELKNAAKYELGKYIPFEVDEVIHDCQRLDVAESPAEGKPAGAEQEMRVLLVAAKRSFLDDHVTVLEGAGLQPAIVDVDSFALGNAFELIGRINPEAMPPDKTIAIIDVGATKTNINIMRGASSYFTREFYKGGDDITDTLSKKLGMEVKEAEMLKRNPGSDVVKVTECIGSVIDDICHDINISIDFFENQYDQKVDELYLTGGASQTINLLESIEKTLQKPISRWNPIESMPMELDRVSKDELNNSPFQSVIALGLASRILRN